MSQAPFKLAIQDRWYQTEASDAVIMDIFIFILYRGNVILELLPLRYYSLVK